MQIFKNLLCNFAYISFIVSFINLIEKKQFRYKLVNTKLT